MTLFYALIEAQLDFLMRIEYVQDSACIGFIASEALYIMENAGYMRISIPDILRRRIKS